jgi:NTP pyrophosphatase (non-canonical NTP hydrolase)
MLLAWWQDFVDRWASKTFPEHTHQGIALHLVREATELALACGLEECHIQESVKLSVEKHPAVSRTLASIMGETADVTILALAMAGYIHLQLEDYVAAKMSRNIQRKWGEPDAQGVAEHEGEPDPV